MFMRVLFSLATLLGTGLAVQAQETQSTPPAAFATFDGASKPVLSDPHDLTIGPDGRLYVADKLANRIAILDAETLEVVGSFGKGELFAPRDISFDNDGRAIIADSGNSRVAIYDFSSGAAKLAGEIIGVARTEGATAHPNGRIYANVAGFALTAFDDGVAVATVQGHSGAHDVAVGPDGSLWVPDMGNGRIVHYSPDLELLSVFDDAKFGFSGPRYLDVDAQGRLVVADQDAHRILMIDKDGALVGVLGTGQPGEGPNLFDDPEGVAISGTTYYFADSDNNRVVRYRVVMN